MHSHCLAASRVILTADIEFATEAIAMKISAPQIKNEGKNVGRVQKFNS